MGKGEKKMPGNGKERGLVIDLKEDQLLYIANEGPRGQRKK